ncbi:NUDIX hydrolase [Anaeromicropila herbilytica]|uniref:Nudix hydrolase domain-containing protein n=1 Tax=Anaeromicropila herbilytica TaxID=2785025 RepID=A0A7R7IEU0_9FIRM|nr:NUDIX hydrolase [Anaeromicropila herbilytica]BCN32977.1 hypothetical protein bsdtb5_42720 [Anaeromicropila herbilytica]
MPAFLKNYETFYGDHSKNPKGQDLDSFLEEYDTTKYENPSVTADILVFQHKKDLQSVTTGLKLLMVKRKDHPCIGYWALPGGFVNIREDVSMAAKRELEEETNLKNIPIEQVYAWGEYDRDPRARIVTVSYLALVDEDLQAKAGDDASDVTWADVSLNYLGNDEIEENGKARLQHTYELKLISEEKELQLNATVTMTENKCGLLKEKDYQVVKTDGIAFDHPRFIVQALLYIEEALKNNR